MYPYRPLTTILPPIRASFAYLLSPYPLPPQVYRSDLSLSFTFLVLGAASYEKMKGGPEKKRDYRNNYFREEVISPFHLFLSPVIITTSTRKM